jgi:pimeloyl-ACP methyl ester carboxylesterase
MSTGRTDTRFLGADGAELTVSTWPDATGPDVPVLLLHGLSQQRLFWGPVVSRMHSSPVASLDQRGHGASDTRVDADYSIGACATDVVACLDALGWQRAVVAGHSWGGSVALRAAAVYPDRVAAAALIDGGLWSPAGMGPREEVRARLTPPTLGLPPEQLWSIITSGELGPGWSPEKQEALEFTFVADADGRLHSRLGLARHLAVLDGLLDTDPAADLAACEQEGTRLWAAICDPRQPDTGGDDPWNSLKSTSLQRAGRHRNLLIHRWAGAIHDVPLQWPDLVAGFIDTVVGSVRDAGWTLGGGE